MIFEAVTICTAKFKFPGGDYEVTILLDITPYNCRLI
jgi:hypothetical protein